jgi:CheY-like chemotaxis protein
VDTSQWRILIAEDEYDSIQMISKILSHYGIQLQIAHNGDECLEMLKAFEPTLVIVDLAMPEKDGWETLTAIRADPSTAHLPVVAVTAYYAVDVAEDAMKAGFDGFFSKPLSPTRFVQSLEQIVASYN